MQVEFASRFEAALNVEKGKIPLEKFPKPEYLNQLSEAVIQNPPGLTPAFKNHYETYGMYLMDCESSRHEKASFGKEYLNLYSRELNILITTDSILYAWHKTYDAMLKELELTCLIPLLRDDILLQLDKAAAQLSIEYKDGPFAPFIADVRGFISIALTLITLRFVPGMDELLKIKMNQSWHHDKESSSLPPKQVFGQADSKIVNTVTPILKLIEAAKDVQSIEFFGTKHFIDFSQFKPRGHYAKDKHLSAYFAAMMWLGRFSFVIQNKPEDLTPPALLLHKLIKESGCYASWKKFDAAIQVFVGKSDNITFGDLDKSLEISNIKSVETKEQLEKVKTTILQDPSLKQQYQTGVTVASNPKSAKTEEIPVIFAFLGQRFCMDGWAISQITHDRVIHNGKKVPRRMVSGLDIAFSVFGNHATISDIIERMTRSPDQIEEHLKWRDGLVYSENLVAVKQVIDNLPEQAWEESLYTLWLSTLRALSEPTTDRLLYPEAMRTEAYAKKNLATQLGSYTELKHDTILYAKQPTMGVCGCDVPHGFVEPKITFWKQMIKMVNKTQVLLKSIEPNPKPKAVDTWTPEFWSHAESCLTYFKGVLETLLQISIKQINKELLNPEESFWLRQVVEDKVGGSGMGSNTGWYYGLFFSRGVYGSGQIVADIASSYDDPLLAAPGQVLSVGLSSVQLLGMQIEHVGRSTNSSLPGKGLTIAQRRYELRSGGFGYRPPPPKKPSSTSTNERVPGWEKMPKFVSETGEFIQTVMSGEIVVPKSDKSAKGVFIGPVFSYREFITGQASRLNDAEWKAMSHPPPPSYLTPFYLPSSTTEVQLWTAEKRSQKSVKITSVPLTKPYVKQVSSNEAEVEVDLEILLQGSSPVGSKTREPKKKSSFLNFFKKT